jgi:hypothetical protein
MSECTHAPAHVPICTHVTSSLAQLTYAPVISTADITVLFLQSNAVHNGAGLLQAAQLSNVSRTRGRATMTTVALDQQ